MTNDIELKKGESFNTTFSITSSGTAYDLTGFSGTFYVKTDAFPTSTTVLTQEVTISSPTGGSGSIALTATQTNTLSNQTYYYETVFTNGSTGAVIKQPEGTITILNGFFTKGYTNEDLIEAEIGTNITSSTTPSSLQVSEWIREAEDEIDEKTGTTFSSGTVTNSIQSYDEHTELLVDRAELGYSGVFLLDENGKKVAPIISITSLYRNVSSDDATDSWSLLTENTGTGGDFILDKLTGMVTFVSNAPYLRKRAIKWTGAVGNANVSPRVKKLATKLVAQRVLQSKVKKNMFSNTDSYSLEGFSRRKELSQNVTYLESLQTEIDKLWEEMTGSFQSEIVK